jgi:hypothetical protein
MKEISEGWEKIFLFSSYNILQISISLSSFPCATFLLTTSIIRSMTSNFDQILNIILCPLCYSIPSVLLDVLSRLRWMYKLMVSCMWDVLDWFLLSVLCSWNTPNFRCRLCHERLIVTMRLQRRSLSSTVLVEPMLVIRKTYSIFWYLRNGMYIILFLMPCFSLCRINMFLFSIFL